MRHTSVLSKEFEFRNGIRIRRNTSLMTDQRVLGEGGGRSVIVITLRTYRLQGFRSRTFNGSTCAMHSSIITPTRDSAPPKIQSTRHAAVCINIEKSMVTRDVGVPPQWRPMSARAYPLHPLARTLLIHAQTGVLILQRAAVPNGREFRVAVKGTTRRN